MFGKTHIPLNDQPSLNGNLLFVRPWLVVLKYLWRKHGPAQRDGGECEQKIEGQRGDASPGQEAVHPGNPSGEQEQWLLQWARCYTH